MSNPYSSPGSRPTYPPNYMTAQTPPTHLVAAPSIALMTIAIVSLVVFALAVLFNGVVFEHLLPR